jgi:two-component system, cell cycle sensor histidine kinase and response regulator CckA
MNTTAALFQLVLDNIPQFIFWKDRNSVYLGCNQNFARVAGVSTPDAIAGKTDFDLAWKHEEAAFFRQVDAEVMSTGVGRYNIIEPQLQANGKEAWLETSKIPMFDNAGKVVGILGMYADITERRAVEQAHRQAQKMESIGRLAGGVAHDFNNLLTGIIGLTEILQSRLSEPEQLQITSRIVSTAERAADLTRKLLSFSRRGVMERRPVDLHNAIDNVVALLKTSVNPDTQIVTEFRAIHRVVLGDVSEIENALLNLGLNARDAMPDGGRLSFETQNLNLTASDHASSEFSVTPGEFIRITVRDTGAGISSEAWAQLFEPFFTTKLAGRGTGLGLPSVYGAAVAHRGAIAVQSEPGCGSAFILDLPVTHDKIVVKPPVPPGQLFPRTATILVIDDQDDVLDVIERMLEHAGLNTVSANTGQKGIALFSATPNRFEAAILDVMMPEMSGRDCYRALKAIRPELPIIMASGFTDDQLIEEITQDGASAFVKKPFRREELISAIAKAIDV